MPVPPSDCAAILLAAGAGSRFTGSTHKLLAPFHGTTVFASSLASLEAAGFARVIVITGAVELPDESRDGTYVEFVTNDRWAEGQATSVRCGVEHARRLGFDSVVIGLADQPMVTPEAWRAVAHAPTPIGVATYGGERGNPVKLHSSTWHLLPADGDVGARDIIRLHPELVSEVACDGSGADIDTHEDLDTWT